MQVVERLVRVLDELGIARAHFATQAPGDLAGLLAERPDCVASLTLAAPSRVDPAPLRDLAERLLYVAPAGGLLGQVAARTTPALASAKIAPLEGYAAESWSDLAADRPDLAGLIAAHAATCPGASEKESAGEEGEIAGIRYTQRGKGPVLVLTPLVLAPNQWAPLVPALAEHFCVVSLAGPHLGMLSLLEERAALPDWRHMCAGLFDGLQLNDGDAVLDVGCGSGAVAKQFVAHTGGKNPLTALDLSPYLLGEAKRSAKGLSIQFEEGSAEALPFADNSFAAAYSITVLEECSAEKGLAELARVVRPGGRVGVIVRGVDLVQWWNLPVSDALRAKISMPAASVAPGGVASAALYDLGVAAGLLPERMFPFMVASDSVGTPITEYPETHALSLVSAAEQAEYRAAKAQAIAAGTWFMTRGHHCFIGQVPG